MYAWVNINIYIPALLTHYDTPVAMSTPRARILVSKSHSLIRGTGNWLIPGLGQGKSKMSLVCLMVLERKEMLTKLYDGECQMLKEPRADLKELLGNNWSNKTNSSSIGL